MLLVSAIALLTLNGFLLPQLNRQREELGITRANVDQMRMSNDIEVRRFFAPPPTGASVVPGWTYNIIKAVGNYGEIYDRHLGSGSRAKLARGMNRLWKDGGLMYAPPIR